ncbi:MAG TPA: hypothetical protein P5280_03595 [Cyclobacteriaceae bacterium]|nr:hypothetical protein [Cyclobacteriaceae bacterium]
MADIEQRLVFSDDAIKTLDAIVGRLEAIERQTRDVEEQSIKTGRTMQNALDATGKKIGGAITGFTKMVGVLAAVGASEAVLSKVGDALGNIVEGNKQLSSEQDALKGKFNEVLSTLGQKFGPAFSAVFDLASNAIDKVLGLLGKMNESVGVKLAATIKASSAVVGAFFSNTGKFIQIAVNDLKIFGKNIKLALTFNDGKRESIKNEISDIRKENSALSKEVVSLKNTYNTTFDEAYKKAKKLADSGVYNLKKQTEEARKQAEELRKEYNKLYDDLTGKLQKLQLDQLGPVDRAKAELELSLKELDGLEEALTAKAKALGKDSDFKQQFDDLRNFAKLQANRQIDQLSTPAALKGPSIIPTLDTTFGTKESLLKYTDGLVQNMKDGIDTSVNQLNPFDALKLKLQETFNLDEGQFNDLLGQVGDALGSILNSLTVITDAQIAENDRYIESINDRKQATIDALNEELKNKEDGYANNVAAKRAELEDIQKQEAAALQRKAELDKKKARQQLLQDSLTQASSLATGAAQLIAAESGKGLIGIALAAAAIAFMFKIFANAKRNASESTTKLYKGGALRKKLGFVEKGGRDDRVTSGYRIQDTEYEIGGNEYLMNAKTSLAQEHFLDEMNAGKYDGVDLRRAVASGLHMNAAAINAEMKRMDTRSPKQRIATKDDIDSAFERLGDRMIQYLENERPVVLPAGGYTKEFKGGKKVERVRPSDSVTDLLKELIRKK